MRKIKIDDMGTLSLVQVTYMLPFAIFCSLELNSRLCAVLASRKCEGQSTYNVPFFFSKTIKYYRQYVYLRSNTQDFMG